MSKKTVLSALMTTILAIGLILSLSLSAFAASITVSITGATFYDSGALKSMTTNFSWHSASANTRLVLMSKALKDGDFTNFGNYSSFFVDFDDVLDYDSTNGTFGIKAYSDESAVSPGDNTKTINLADGTVSLSADGTYYIYLWTRWSGLCYPDHLIAAIKVQNGVLKYAKATGENTYDESAFDFVVAAEKYDVTVVPAANMTKTTDSGAESQADLDVTMEEVIYTANAGYYFPETYAVAEVNNIRVTRIDETKISVSGMPLDDTTINLTAPTKRILPLEDMVFDYAYDAQRSPAFPKAGQTISLGGLDYPLIGHEEFGETNEGEWTLTKIGTYSIVKNTARDSEQLQSIIEDIATNYPNMTDANIVIHELKDGDKHIAYGVAVAYDEDQEIAVFIGDTWRGGAGYLLTNAAKTGNVTCVADTDVTDWVAPTAYSITITDSEFGTTIASASKAIAGDTITITTTPAEGCKLVSVDGGNITLTDLGNGEYSFVMPEGNVTITTTYAKNEYTVIYKVNGEVVDTQTIKHGEDATAPSIPAKEGYTAAWDKDGKNITTNTEINAVYTIKTYTVVYKVNGEIIATFTVEYGKDATAPSIPAKEGFTAAWDKDGKNITADTEINAVYTEIPPSESPKNEGPEAQPPKKDEEEIVVPPSEQPQTGDRSNLMLYLALMLASGACLLGLLRKKQEG